MSRPHFIAIVLASVSFVGYVVVKYFGMRRGLLLAAAAGGLASSTAVTITNARHAAAGEGAPGCLQPASQLPRRLCSCVSPASWLCSSLNCSCWSPPHFSPLCWRRWGSLLPGRFGGKPTAGNTVAGGFAIHSIFSRSSDLPFSLALLSCSAARRRKHSAQRGVAGAIVVGLADVDAVTVSMLRLTPDNLSRAQAVSAILAAVASDTVSKVAIGAAIGRG